MHCKRLKPTLEEKKNGRILGAGNEMPHYRLKDHRGCGTAYPYQVMWGWLVSGDGTAGFLNVADVVEKIQVQMIHLKSSPPYLEDGFPGLVSS